MNMRQVSIVLTLLSIVGFYLSILPLYVQGGDSSELVLAAKNLFVPHPPGYPLYVWLLHLWLNVVQIQTVFYSAALFCALSGILGLLLLSSFKTHLLSIILVIISLGLKKEFLEASILPDVFSLHALMICLIGYFYFRKNQTNLSIFSVPFLITLGVAHHHTIIWMFPVFIASFLENYKEGSSIKWWCLGVLSGFIVLIGLYLSLLGLNTNSYFSWGALDTLDSLSKHFLREDYGTFSLSVNRQRSYAPLFFLLKSLAWFIGPIVMYLIKISKDRAWNKSSAWGLCFMLSIGFTLMMNVPAEGVGGEVLERFHIMPLTLLVIGFLYISESFHKWWSLTLVPVILFNLMNIKEYCGFRDDQLIQNHSMQLLDIAKENIPAIVIAENDTSYFSMRFLQGIHPEKYERIVVATPEMFFYPWFKDKTQKIIPEFMLDDRVSMTREMNLMQDLFGPNLDKVNFVTTSFFKYGDWYQVEFFPLGRVARKGEGVIFNREFEISISANYPWPQIATKKLLTHQYSHYFLAQAYESKDKEVIRNNCLKAKSILGEGTIIDSCLSLLEK